MTESTGVLVAFSAGLLSFLSPCVLPLFPSYLSFITGMSVDHLREGVDVAERGRVVSAHHVPPDHLIWVLPTLMIAVLIIVVLSWPR